MKRKLDNNLIGLGWGVVFSIPIWYFIYELWTRRYLVSSFISDLVEIYHNFISALIGG